MKKSYRIIAGLSGFLAGVLLYRLVQPDSMELFWVILISIFCFILAKKSRYCIIFLFIMALAVGLGRAKLSEHRVTPKQIDFYNRQTIEIEGIIVEMDMRRDKAKYTFRIKNSGLRIKQEEIFGVAGDILITLAKYPQYHYGDRLRLSGELKEPGEFDDFSYSNYLNRFGIYSVMHYPKVGLVKVGEGNWFWRAMNLLREEFLGRLNRLFPEPHGSFEAGLLVGARKGIPPDLLEKFNITGLSHIIAISGFNITIIIAAVMWMLSWMARRWRFYVAVAAVALFTLFVGASPAVVRASIMGILGLLALHTGRQNTIHLTVLWTAFFMVLWNPKILWWDVGFQLSFAAVLGLIYVAPLFKKWLVLLPQTLGIREAVQMTLAAQVMALPIILYNFERLSLIAPISNLLVVFAIPPAMLFGFAAVTLSFVFYPVALGMAYIAWGILSYIIKIVELTAAIPYASVNLPGMRLWMMVGYYLFLGLFLYFWSKKTSSRKA